MSLPTSLSAYRDCEALFTKATEGQRGARAKLASYDACIQLRTRLHYFRTLDRKANAETYPHGHPQHGQSVYDEYVVQIFPDEDAKRTGEFWLYIQRRSAGILALETLDDDTANLLEAEVIDAPLAIEDQSQ